jgi:hypothetical protein
MARECGAPAACKQIKEIIQARGDLFRGKHIHPRGGEFDGKRNPIEALTDPGDERSVLHAKGETLLYEPGAFHE